MLPGRRSGVEGSRVKKLGGMDGVNLVMKDKINRNEECNKHQTMCLGLVLSFDSFFLFHVVKLGDRGLMMFNDMCVKW